jgi:hypothetical protein
MTKMENLTNELFDLFDNVKNDKIDINKARLMNNISGKAIKSVCVQMKHNINIGETSKSIDSVE